MKKILLSIMLCAVLLIVSASVISACDYNNHHDCNVKANTLIQGKITLDDDAAGKAVITVTCSHDGTDYTRTAKSSNSHFLKGTYLVRFPQTQCITGDLVTVTATKNGLTGTATKTVTDFITEDCLNVDIALIDVNIPLVPEFGLVAGALTIFGAAGTFFVVRRK
jgi:hypothetical protein